MTHLVYLNQRRNLFALSLFRNKTKAYQLNEFTLHNHHSYISQRFSY